MRFTKMHGAGNDYIYVDCFDQPLPDDLPRLARLVSDRHCGVGADGLILIRPSKKADARMQMFNADGSEAEMCGNGVRCVAKYVYDHELCRKKSLRIETGAGVLTLDVETAGRLVDRVRVDIGEPVLAPKKIPTTLPGKPSPWDTAVYATPLEVAGESLRVTCASMGNPHAVTFVDWLTDRWVLDIGPKIEVDPHFPKRVNAEFVEILSRDEVRMRVWERGSGETLACGTGAAAGVAGVLTDQTDRKITVHLLGGDLELEWSDDDNHVYMTGPAVEVFSGEWPE